MTWFESPGLLIRFLRKLPRRGRWRVARTLLARSVLDRQNCVVVSCDGDKFRVPSLREPIAFALLVDGDYEVSTWNTIREYLPVGGTFVDLGSNIGLLSLKAARHVGANGRVIAVEASPTIYPYLVTNLEAAGRANFTALQLAVTSEDNVEISFYEAPTEKFGVGSLAPQFDSSGISVRGRTLDSILDELRVDRVDVVKIDVEGFEGDIFLGAQRLLSSRNKPTIVFEFLDWAEERSGRSVGFAQSILRDHGYVLRIIDEASGRSDELRAPLTVGGAMLVAIPPRARDVATSHAAA
jgi:FkbM family methyltransferase